MLGQIVAIRDDIIDATTSLSIYQHYLLWLGVITIVLGIVYFPNRGL